MDDKPKMIRRANGRLFRMNFIQPWDKYMKMAVDQFTGKDLDPPQTPTDEELYGLAYRLALQDVEEGFSQVQELCRNFQDSDIQCDFGELQKHTDKNWEVLYEIKIIVTPEAGDTDKEQLLFNTEFTRNLDALQEALKAKGFIIV